MDLSAYSEDDLKKLAAGNAGPQPSSGGQFGHLSDEQLAKIASNAKPAQQEKGGGSLSDFRSAFLREKVGPYVKPVLGAAANAIGNVSERYLLGTPSAYAKDALLNVSRENPEDQRKFYEKSPIEAISPYVKALPGAVMTGLSHYGERTPEEMRGTQEMIKHGLSQTTASQAFPDKFKEPSKAEWYQPEKGGLLDVSPASVAGTAYDLAEPSNLIPYGKIGKGIQAGVEAAAPLVEKAAAKTLGTLSTLPENVIKTYIKRGETVSNAIKEFGKDHPEFADKIRSQYQSDIAGAKKGLNESITKTLASAPTEASIDAKPVLESLEKYKKRLDPVYNMDELSNIDEMMDKIKTKLTPEGLMTPQDAFKTKGFLDVASKGSYMRNGAIFNAGPETAKAAQMAAREARLLVNESMPEIAQANNQLSQLHAIERNMNKNLLATGKPDAALLSAGSGANQRNVKSLQKLENITGKPMVEKAEDLAAMKAFGNPEVLTMDPTGKSVLRTGLGAGLGYLVGHAPGAVIGGALTSPLGVKTAIDVGTPALKAAGSGINKVGRFMEKRPKTTRGLMGLIESQQDEDKNKR